MRRNNRSRTDRLRTLAMSPKIDVPLPYSLIIGVEYWGRIYLQVVGTTTAALLSVLLRRFPDCSIEDDG